MNNEPRGMNNPLRAPGDEIDWNAEQEAKQEAKQAELARYSGVKDRDGSTKPMSLKKASRRAKNKAAKKARKANR